MRNFKEVREVVLTAINVVLIIAIFVLPQMYPIHPIWMIVGLMLIGIGANTLAFSLNEEDFGQLE
jgi:hypothetical protein